VYLALLPAQAAVVVAHTEHQQRNLPEKTAGLAVVVDHLVMALHQYQAEMGIRLLYLLLLLKEIMAALAQADL
jgi:hypothetical protein